jgi:hypothetical protein
MTQEANYMYDTLLVLKAAGLIAASAAVATIVDTGGTGHFSGEIVIDVSALEIASNDEIYDIVLQGSPDAAFGTAGNIQELAAISLSAKEVKRTDSDKDDVIGRYIMPFRNEFAGTNYRYLRLYTVVAGAVATGINYAAFIGKRKW